VLNLLESERSAQFCGVPTMPEPDELSAYARGRRASHKTPRVWRFVDSFP
jgi:hypothetical protein